MSGFAAATFYAIPYLTEPVTPRFHIVAGGLSNRLEGEEMPVSLPGLKVAIARILNFLPFSGIFYEHYMMQEKLSFM